MSKAISDVLTASLGHIIVANSSPWLSTHGTRISSLVCCLWNVTAQFCPDRFALAEYPVPDRYLVMELGDIMVAGKDGV